MGKVVSYVYGKVSGLSKKDSVAKSRGIRGRITSILTDLRLANEEIQLERGVNEEKHELVVFQLQAQVAELRAQIDDANATFSLKDDLNKAENGVLSEEESANEALARGIEKLING